MSSHGSLKVILIALFANLGIAVSKFFGAVISRSSSLLAEAIHSVVDCTNQGLLLLGNKKAKKEPDEKHPMGYGREAFFWSFIVSILLFSLGGMFAIYEGVHKLKDPHPIKNAWLPLTILGVAIVLEGFSFIACFKEVKKQNRYKNLKKWFKKTTAADLLVIFTEDAAALLGLLLAKASLIIALITGNPAWDAYGSIAVGSLLIIMAVFLAREIKSLIIGERPEKDYKKPISDILKKYLPDAEILKMITLQTGVSEVMISCKIYSKSTDNFKNYVKAINDFEKNVREEFPEIKWQFVEPDIRD